MVTTIKFSDFAPANLNTSTNMIVGVSALSGGYNFRNPLVTNWTTATRPSMPYDGLLGYNTTLEVYEYYNGTLMVWTQLQSSADTGTVTSITATDGLASQPNPITTTGSMGLASVANNTLLANITGTITYPLPVSVSALFDAVFVADPGDILFRGSSIWQALSPGVPGQFLETIGNNSVQWGTPTGSGSVEAAPQDYLAYYPNPGSNAMVGGLATIASGILVTSAGSVPSFSTTLPPGLIILQPLIQGVIDGSSAPTGDVGEYITSQVVNADAISMSTGVSINVTSISLTAGDWDVWGNVSFVMPGIAINAVGWINTVSATNGDLSLSAEINDNAGFSGGGIFGMAVAMQRFNITTTTTIYLGAQSHFSSSTSTVCGFISARRVR